MTKYQRYLPRLRWNPLFFILAGLCVLTTFRPANSDDAPNIVFILADDLGWADVNQFDPKNRRFYETPNIDRLARQGMMFTQAYANAANCAPTRAALISGQYYPHQPIYHVGSPSKGELIPAENGRYLPQEKQTIAEALKPAGYKTALIGKWHIGNPPKYGPQQQGFDVNVGGYNAGNPGNWKGGYKKPNNNPYIDDARPGEHLTDYLTRKTNEFIRTHQDEPFYVQLSYYTPHSPHQPPEALRKRFEQKEGDGGHNDAKYAGMIKVLDRGVGRIMSTLEQLDLAHNTLVVFYSDNGGVGGYGFLGRDGPGANTTSNKPLKGGKTTYYEGGIRVPGIVRWPEKITAGSVSEEPIMTIDFYPTFLDAASLDPPDDYLLDGVSLMPLFRDSGATLDREYMYWHFPGYPNNAWRTGPVSVIRSGPWKLLQFYEDQSVKLYDLDKDISESDNRADDRPEIRDRLRSRLDHWLKSNDAPMPRRK